MIWVAWRQHRAQLAAGSLLLAVLLAFLLATGFGIASTFRSSGLARCLAQPGADCGTLADAFTSRYNNLQFLVPLFLALPAIIGLFWGAPLVAREIEQGTHRLAWTQGVSRLRWMNVKVAVVGGATAVGAGAVTWVLTWWSRPLVAASDSRLNPGVFDLRGIVPVAYAVFAVALGVAIGCIVRRVVPAMAATIAAYVAVRVAVVDWLRPHFAAAKTVTFSLLARKGPFAHGSLPFGHDTWVLSMKTLDRAGRFMGNGATLNINALAPRCPGLIPQGPELPDPSRVQACAQRLRLHVVARYQPGSRFWMFQGVETGIFVALAAGLFVLAAWWVRRQGNLSAQVPLAVARRLRHRTASRTTMAIGISDSRASHCDTGSWMPTSLAVRP